jgi:hypothetical protein
MLFKASTVDLADLLSLNATSHTLPSSTFYFTPARRNLLYAFILRDPRSPPLVHLFHPDIILLFLHPGIVWVTVLALLNCVTSGILPLFPMVFSLVLAHRSRLFYCFIWPQLTRFFLPCIIF